ncbi:RNA polymerase sigma factor [Pleomorphovibrio marinus]|uniref:RNA polymerase sigma factor n=1 Tax=Pleomorphovibrio marinus TaxID=2164132 RepID=UPI000E0A9C9C|nr:sigma-70 family RNA polymerase sigma factor [Pleomorphovibrio marinus]
MNVSSNTSTLVSPERYWSLLVEGDRKGLEGIYRCYARDLFKFGMSIFPDYDFVQDCVQEVFLDVWKYHKSLGEVSNSKVYLFRTMSHKIFKEAKRLKKRVWEEINEDNAKLLYVDCVESELVALQAKEHLQKKLAMALEKLPHRQKQVLLHLFFDKFTYEEVSKIMGINLRSTYTLAWKAIASVKKHLLLPILLFIG